MINKEIRMVVEAVSNEKDIDKEIENEGGSEGGEDDMGF